MDSSILDDVYECAFLPDAWSDILAWLAAIAGARSGWMMVSQPGKDQKDQFVGSNPIVRAAVEPMVRNGVVAESDRFARLCRAERPGFLREADVY